jgi:hypothetical protein
VPRGDSGFVGVKDLQHHKLEEILDEYLKATGLEKEPGAPLFMGTGGYIGAVAYCAPLSEGHPVRKAQIQKTKRR